MKNEKKSIDNFIGNMGTNEPVAKTIPTVTYGKVMQDSTVELSTHDKLML